MSFRKNTIKKSNWQRYKTAIIIVIVVVLAIVGGTVIATSKAESLQISGPVTFDSNGVPSGYVKCAEENGTCVINGSNDFIYGGNGNFIVRQNQTKNISCNSTLLSDPAPNITKNCYIRQTKLNNNPLNSNYTFCASQGNKCMLKNNKNIVYGSNGYYVYKANMSGELECNSNIFGDPNPFYAKQCWFEN